jgi:hypothetical protein
MKLIEVRVQNYKSILDSGWVSIDQVTCLVGKNESGKTAFLQAIEKLNPVEPSHANFNYVFDYPASKYTSYKREHATTPAVVVEARYEFDEDTLQALVGRFGPDALRSKDLVLQKKYDNSMSWTLEVDELAAVKHLAKRVAGGTDALHEAAAAATTASELAIALESFGPDDDSAQKLLKLINSWSDRSLWQGVVKLIKLHLPRFFYFDDYSSMRGMVSLDDLIRRIDNDGTIDDSERPFLALLDLIGASAEELRDETSIEKLTRELEGASVAITDEMFEFWRQNDALQVNFVRQEADPNDPAPLNAGRVLAVRIYNPNHRASVPFDQRSKGFVWFFSFLVFFQRLKAETGHTILLLDEPALSLHALAQGDFLRFLEERLAPAHQVIYSTHSPFMIEPGRLDRVRTVFDRGRDIGSVVSDDVFKTDRDTVFPLQAALGYDLAQTLFVGPDNLLVEGTSDLIYLEILNQKVAEAGGETLSDRWVVVPVGGADKLSTFVTLLGGNQLNAVALMDVSKKDQQRVDNLLSNGLLAKNGLVQVNEFTTESEADIEDLFAPAFYLRLVNGAYKKDLGKNLTQAALGKGSPRIVKRIEQYFATNKVGTGKFSHQRPATYLLREQVKLMGDIEESTVQRAGLMFKRVNKLLS